MARKIFDLPRYEEDARMVVVGVCFDSFPSFLRGCADAPDAIRRASLSIETFSVFQGKDLQSLSLEDLGNWFFLKAPEEMSQQLFGDSLRLFQQGKLPIFLGGAHTITLPIVQAALHHYGSLSLLVLDAHLDLRDEFEGSPLNHATWLRRLSENFPGKIYVAGVRSACPEEMEYVRKRRIHYMFSSGDGPFLPVRLGIPQEEWLYISVDLDVLDSSVFPAVSNPEPGGLTFSDVRSVLSFFSRYHIIGMDFVEFNPHLDYSRHCAVTAAVLLRETLLYLGR
ncbi:MAG: agmatinase [bacterium JZ-2024 1]